MRFVVPIPLSLYLFFCFIAFAISMYVFAIVAALGFIYFLFKAPKETIGLILILLAFKYWQFAMPLLAVAVLINYFLGDKKNNEPESLLVDENSEAAPQENRDKPNT